MTRATRLALVAAALLAAASPAAAQQAAQVQPTAVRQAPSITVSALNTTAEAEAGSRGRSAMRATVQPGDVLRYTLTFANATDKPVREVELRDPIPAGVRFVAGSARASRADARLELSIDGGRSWSAQPTERVMVDGRAVVRPVSPDRYTHVRWIVGGAVPARGTVTAHFEVRVAGAGA